MAISNPPQIAGQILQDVVGRLSDPDIGFNTQLPLTISNNPRYAANASNLSNINLIFPSDYTGRSPNVLLAPLSIDDWLDTGPTPIFNGMLMQVYIINTISKAPPGNTKGMVIDGSVNVGIDCHIGWPGSKPVYDFDAPVSAVEDTIYTLFNTFNPAQPLAYQQWSRGTIWNGVLSVPSRSQIVKGGPNWMQLTTFTLAFGIYKPQ